MSSSASERMLKLMAYADGELEGRELDEVEGWLAKDPTAARFTNELAGLGELVKIGHGESKDAKAVRSFDIADSVMAKVTAATSEAARPAPVVSFAASRERRQKNLKVAGAGICAVLALAASVFVMTRTHEEQPMARTVVPAEPAPSNATGAAGVDVDLVETPGHSVSVFYLPSESTLTTSVVVWVDETGDKK